MPRYFLDLSYLGTQYSGWQIQPNAVSVQQQIQEALSRILGEAIHITGSGRTDTGVHARQQFAHFDSEHNLQTDQLFYQLNAVLPPDISINRIHTVQIDAHARFSATSRSYEYFMHQAKNPFLHGFSYYFHPELDLEKMNRAAEIMLSLAKHNYACFAKSGHSSISLDCHILEASWYVLEESRLVFRITADRFLRGMVRAIVGTLLEVGTRKLSVTEFRQIIQSRNRTKAGRSVPACGLYLSRIRYPEHIFI